MSKIALIILLIISIFLNGLCIAQDDQTDSGTYIEAGTDEVDIVDTLTASGNFNSLLAAVNEAGLTDTFKGPGPFTLFAPTDGAFAMIPQANLDALRNNTADLTDLLTYHVVRGEIMSGDLMNKNTLETMDGRNLTITTDGNSIRAENARIIQADIEATNGVVHVIDAVITPTQITET